MARKGVKSRRRITGLRSKTTKARTHVNRLRAANADLKKKLAEALEQEAATSEILRVISASLAAIQPVHDVIVRNAARLCEAEYVDLLLRDGDVLKLAASHGSLPTAACHVGVPLYGKRASCRVNSGNRVAADRRNSSVHGGFSKAPESATRHSFRASSS